MNSLLLLLALLCHLLPMLFRYSGGSAALITTAESALQLSRASSIVMLIAYAAYIVFQLWTHRQLFETQEVILLIYNYIHDRSCITIFLIHNADFICTYHFDLAIHDFKMHVGSINGSIKEIRNIIYRRIIHFFFKGKCIIFIHCI